MLIKDILTIDLSEDIKNVIDLEDISEMEIKSEIENYIVTDGLAAKFSDFVNTYTSNIKESGVWISGFYGSGKSYFGKLLGYMLSNRSIMGTPARERILQRFTGIADEALVKNTISRLNSINSRVIALDSAKQDTSKGFAYTLFRNFLRSLGLPENEHGFLLYQLMINEQNFSIANLVFEKLNKDWQALNNKLIAVVSTTKELFLALGNNEADYQNMLTTIRRDIDQFDPARLRDEIRHYMDAVKDEKIVFLFDEASEAINQGKIDLTDLEGISEALSSLGNRVWTIAIAQEKLDDVLSSAKIDKSKLIKVTDRFKTKIHLEATEVDIIIRSRLLGKTEEGNQMLLDHYRKNSGKITDHTALLGAGIIKTENPENYATYYPFYKYQFDLLQNFLFGTKGYASTKVAARGMIITTYDVLRRALMHNKLFEATAGWQISKEAQPQPDIRLVNRFETAERITTESRIEISGRKLLETINFLFEAEVVPTTVPNIVKSYINDPDDYHKMLDLITRSLELLTDAKVLLFSNNTYRITSDIEQRLLEEMKGFTVQGFIKKKQLITAYKSAAFTKTIAKLIDNSQQYDFYITTDNDDELTTPALKHLKLRVKSIYTISDNRSGDMEALRQQHQNDKDLIWIVPDNSAFTEIDKLIDDIERTTYLQQKYSDPNSDEAKIILNFASAKSQKQDRMNDLIEQSFMLGTAIYYFNTIQLSRENWQTELQKQQRDVIRNVYHKRLSTQLQDSIAPTIVKEANASRLHQYFQGSDFAFFDTKGNFIGENLKVAEEITYRMRNTFVDGATLEKELEQPPTNFAFGTVISTVAALMRAGKIIAKHNGSEKYSWRDEGVPAIFANAREFRKASFKAISKNLNALQRQEMAQFLLDVEVDKHTGKKIDFNTNDFEMVNAVRELARHFADKVANMQSLEKDFDKLFPTVNSQKELLMQFTGAVSEANYIEKATEILSNKTTITGCTQDIDKVARFIRNNLPKVKEWKLFVDNVTLELTKAATPNKIITDLTDAFLQHYRQDVLKNYGALQQTAQKIKDEYHNLFEQAMQQAAAKYKALYEKAQSLIREIEALPDSLNRPILEEAKTLSIYASQRTLSTIELGFDVKDSNSKFTYSEVLSHIELYPTRLNRIELLQSTIERTEKPAATEQTTPQMNKVIKVALPGTRLNVASYKQWLHTQLQKLTSANDNDEINFET